MTSRLEESQDDCVDMRQPNNEQVLSCLADPYCRRLIEAVETPKSALELSDECGISKSTVYEKLKELVDCSLVEKNYRVDEGSRYRAQYVTAFRRVIVETEHEIPNSDFHVTVIEK